MNSSREDYLIAIYRLTQEDNTLNSVTLAKKLDVTRAAVSEMVRKLVKEELITFTNNQIVLTEHGMEIAKNLLSSHRLWEIFLIDYLKMSPEDAHDQADQLEHVTGEKLLLALNKYLNYPTESPKGNIIWENV